MINILSIRCGLAFAPYLAESAAEFLASGSFNSTVIRQGGTGLIIRSDEEMMLRHQNYEAALGRPEALHYAATVGFRKDFYDIRRMQDEIILATVANEILLSHPQSELWLGQTEVSLIIRAFRGFTEPRPPDLPEWLTVSAAAGRVLISDQRNGKWVLLGSDHVEELERRLNALASVSANSPRRKPPAIQVKGIAVHLQSAFGLMRSLEGFAETGEIGPFEDITPAFRLVAGRAAEGLELRDSDRRATFNQREARKWAGIIAAELERLNAEQIERGKLRSVFADSDGGRWILQWGDEIFLPGDLVAELQRGGECAGSRSELALGRAGEFLLMLSPATGACVALPEEEAARASRS